MRKPLLMLLERRHSCHRTGSSRIDGEELGPRLSDRPSIQAHCRTQEFHIALFLSRFVFPEASVSTHHEGFNWTVCAAFSG